MRTPLGTGAGTAAIGRAAPVPAGRWRIPWSRVSGRHASGALTGVGRHAAGALAGTAHHASGALAGTAHHAAGTLAGTAHHAAGTLAGTAHHASGALAGTAHHATGARAGTAHHAAGTLAGTAHHAAGSLTAFVTTPAAGFHPTANILPGGRTLLTLVNGLGGWALLLSLAGLVIGAALWALGAHSQNYQQSFVGKRAVLVSAAAALIIGAAPAIIDFFFHTGLHVSAPLPAHPVVQ